MRLLQVAEEILHVVPYLVCYHVGIGEVATRAHLILHLFIER